MLTPQLEKLRIFTFYSKPFVWKDFMIEGNVEGACGGGGNFLHFSTFTVVEMHSLPSMLALTLKRLLFLLQILSLTL